MEVASTEDLVAVHAVVSEERVYSLINALKRAGAKRHPCHGDPADDPLIMHEIFPAVDILGDTCVQLVQGKRESATSFGDPLSCADRWIDDGADALHVVNLDGAFGNSTKNADLIRAW